MIELTTEFLITILIFVVLFSIGFTILTRIFDRTPAAVISITVALLGSWYLTNEQISIVTQFYGITQSILLMLVPAIIAFFFIYSFLDVTSIIRRSFWFLYGTFNILLLLNMSNIPEELGTNMIIAVLIITLILILFDTGIKNILNTRKNLKKIK